jgi:Raf kinase inhibitor-like YbhB/YbcL family protein
LDCGAFALTCGLAFCVRGCRIYRCHDIPAADGELPERTATSNVLPDGARQGLNDFGRIGYGGPCPPRGKKNRYFFKLYALDRLLDLKPGATKKDVERAMKTHSLAQGQLMGTYQRK